MKHYFKPFLFLAFASALFFLNRRHGWSEAIASEQGLNFLRAMVRDNYWKASALYIAATVSASVFLALPGVTFALAAGVLFGPMDGTVLCLLASTAGASLSFLAGRYFLRDAVKPMAEKNRYLKKILFEDVEKSGVVLLMITRLLPVFPYNLQNFAYGVTDIGFWPYTLYTFIFLFPGVALFTVGAAGLAARQHRWAYFLASALLALLVAFIGLYLRKRYVKTGEEAGEGPA